MCGDYDWQIDECVWQSYGIVMYCNGNGVCYNFDLDDVMCLLWKVMCECVQLLKGCVLLMCEWLCL